MSITVVLVTAVSIKTGVYRRIKSIVMLAMVLGLAACGGGSGNKDASETPTSSSSASSSLETSPSPEIKVSFNKSSLSFNYIEGTAPESQVITGSLKGIGDQLPYMGAVVSDGTAAPVFVAIDLEEDNAIIQIYPKLSLAAGSYEGTIKLLACPTKSCTQHYSGSPFTVSYKVNVIAKLAASVSSLKLSSPENSAGASQDIELILPSFDSIVNTRITYTDGKTQWLSAQVAGDQLRLQVQPTSLLPGIYKADLTLSLADKSQSLTIPVVFEVSNGLLEPKIAGLTITNATGIQDMQGATLLSLAPGAKASSWSAASNQPWLKLDNSKGTFDKPVTWHIDVAAFNALTNQAVHKATVTLRADTGMAAQFLIIEANKNLSQIKSLDAVALIAGQEGELRIYGNGFSTLDTPATFISVSDAIPSAVTTLGDGVLNVQLPALNSGDYQVTLKTVSGLLTPSKTLKVISRETYAYQAIATEGLKSSIIWDSVSKSAFVVNRSLKSLMRFTAVDGHFQLAATRNFESIHGIAMSPDHSAVILQSADSKIFKLSPSDLSTLKLFDLQAKLPTSENYLNVPLPIMGGNRLMTSAGWIDLDSGDMVPFSLLYGWGQLAGWAAVSGNGQRMLWPDSGTISSPAPAVQFDLATMKFNPFGYSVEPKFFYRYAVSHDGSSWALNDQVLSFDMTIKGKLKAPDSWLGNETVISRNGDRLYYYMQVTPQENARIYVFDTSMTMTSQVNFPVLGYINVQERPNCPDNLNSGSYRYDCETYSTKIAIADDDQTLFLAGDKYFLVVPISEKFRAASH